MRQDINHNIQDIQDRIAAAELAAGRPAGSVQLLAVSKTKPVRAIVEAYLAGQRHFGENYVQEALSKQAELGAFDLTWHFIGPIQTNKTKAIAEHFAWVHSVDRLKVAERLSAQRPRYLPSLKVCLQVNISEEPSKSGIMLSDLATLAAAVRSLPHLSLCGVMAIPEPQFDPIIQRMVYRRFYEAVIALKVPELSGFSMGMSDDLESAIFEGATWVRIGSALFGARA